MNRLRDDAGEDPTSREEIERLRRTPPTPPMPEMKRRVWIALQQQSGAHPLGGASRFLGRPGIRVFVMASTVVALAGTAGAMIGQRWIAPMLRHVDRPSNGNVVRWRDARSRTPAGLAGTRAREAAPSASPAAPTEPPFSDPVAVPPRLVPPSGTTTLRRSQALPGERAAVRNAARRATPSTRARTEVLEALVALRRQHDPVRAGALLDRYLARRERGALREEALVLAIEAADARGDHLVAQGFARTYEDEYPRGRFRQFSHSHTEAAGASPVSPTPRVDGAPTAPTFP